MAKVSTMPADETQPLDRPLNPQEVWRVVVFVRVFPGERSFSYEELMGWAKKSDEEKRPVGEAFVLDRQNGTVRGSLLTGDKARGETTPLQTAMRTLIGGAKVRLLPEAFKYESRSLLPGNRWQVYYEASITQADWSCLQEGRQSANELVALELVDRRTLYAMVLKGSFSPAHWMLATQEHPTIIIA